MGMQEITDHVWIPGKQSKRKYNLTYFTKLFLFCFMIPSLISSRILQANYLGLMRTYATLKIIVSLYLAGRRLLAKKLSKHPSLSDLAEYWGSERCLEYMHFVP